MAYEVTWIGSPNWRTRTGQIKFITLHWMVGRLAGTDAVFQKNPGTATHYGIGGNQVHQYVTESRAAPGTGTNRAIPFDISIEHEGGWLLPDGTRYKPSPATHQTSAELCADIAKRHGLGRLIVGRNVFRHRDWVATMCPGTLDVEWIVAKANSINGFGTAPAGGGTQIPDPEVRWIQERLIVHGFDPGDVDGIWGPNTESAVKAFQSANGLDPDGIVGPITRPLLAAEREDELSAAEVEQINKHATTEANRVLNGVRREARMRLYHTATRKGAVSFISGKYELLTGTAAEIAARIAWLTSIQQVAPGEVSIEVTEAVFDELLREAQATRYNQGALVAALVAAIPEVEIPPEAIADALEAAAARIRGGL